MAQEAEKILVWSDAGKLEVNYIGLYFQVAKSSTETYFELGRLQLKDKTGNDINLYDGSSYVGWAPENPNSVCYEGPGNGCLYRNHEATQLQNVCLKPSDTTLVGYCSSPASKKFPFLAPFKLAAPLNLKDVTYTQRAGRNSSLSTRAVSKFSLCGSIDGKSWMVLATYDANPPTQDYAVLLNNVTLDLAGNVLNLQMFIKSY